MAQTFKEKKLLMFVVIKDLSHSAADIINVLITALSG